MAAQVTKRYICEKNGLELGLSDLHSHAARGAVLWKDEKWRENGKVTNAISRRSYCVKK